MLGSAASNLTIRGVPAGGLGACARPSVLLRPLWPLVILCFLFAIYLPANWPWELPDWGTRGSERREGVGSFDRCCFQFLFNSSPFYFPNFCSR